MPTTAVKAMEEIKALKVDLDRFQAQPNQPGTWDDALVRMERRVEEKKLKNEIRRRLADLGHTIGNRFEYEEWVKLCYTLVDSPAGCGYNLSRDGYFYRGSDPRYSKDGWTLTP